MSKSNNPGYKLLPEERETLVLWCDQDTNATIQTCNKRLQLQLKRKGYKEISSDTHSTTFECPKKLISFRTLEKTEVESTRKLSEQQLEKLKQGRKLKSNNSSK